MGAGPHSLACLTRLLEPTPDAGVDAPYRRVIPKDKVCTTTRNTQPTQPTTQTCMSSITHTYTRPNMLHLGHSVTTIHQSSNLRHMRESERLTVALHRYAAVDVLPLFPFVDQPQQQVLRYWKWQRTCPSYRAALKEWLQAHVAVVDPAGEVQVLLLLLVLLTLRLATTCFNLQGQPGMSALCCYRGRQHGLKVCLPLCVCVSCCLSCTCVCCRCLDGSLVPTVFCFGHQPLALNNSR